MAVILRDIVEKISHEDIVIAAGQEGLDHVVSWVHMIENLEIAGFLEGGEIAFATGIGLGENLSLLELVKGVHRNSASAIMINLGPFIKEIAPEVIAFGNENAFPILAVQWQVNMAEIMRVISCEITNSERDNMELEVAMRNALLSFRQEELYKDQLRTKAIMPEWNYHAIVMEIAEGKTGLLIGERKLESYKKAMQMAMLHYNKNTVIVMVGGYLVMVVPNADRPAIEEMMSYLLKRCSSIFAKNDAVSCTVGGRKAGIRKLHKSYEQAVCMLNLAKIADTKKNVLYYDDLGAYKLLMAIEDQEVIKEYYDEVIEPIVRYDNYNQTDLYEVMESYLKHSGSVKDTAEELYVHRNTINYKIKKIEEILQVDLSSLDQRMKLMIGCMLRTLQNE